MIIDGKQEVINSAHVLIECHPNKWLLCLQDLDHLASAQSDT